MAERPIRMPAPKVRALLAGTKTQERQVVKPQPIKLLGGVGALAALYRPGDWKWPDKVAGVSTISCKPNGPDGWALENSPFGQPGDQLWVQETFYCDNCSYPNGDSVHCRWREIDGRRVAIPIEEQRIEMLEDMYYRADGEPEFEGAEGPTPWRPSIHMPRWASRITLEITGVRVERLQDISVRDCIAEGIPPGGPENPDGIERQDYRSLWESINGSESWSANPWVWVVEFKRLRAAMGSEA